MNYNDEEVPYTRIHEFKHFHPERDLPAGQDRDRARVLAASPRRATSRTTRSTPPRTARSCCKYRELAKKEPMVLFGGRLGTYKYLDMHMAIGSALSMYENKLRPHFADGAALTERRSRRMTSTDHRSRRTVRLLQRQILPARPRHRRDPRCTSTPSTAALDADKYEIGGNRAAKELNNAAIRQSTSTGARRSTPTRSSRAPRCASQPGEQLSFGTYFNAFPRQLLAALDRSSTDVTLTVRLQRPRRDRHRLPVDGQRPLAARRLGRDRRATAPATFTFELPLKPFVDGGWYWYDVVAGDEDAVVESAEWTAEVPADRAAARHRRHRHHHDEPARTSAPSCSASSATTTGSRPYLDEVLVMEQGTEQGRRLRVLPRGRRRRSATSCGSSSRATSAAPAASPAASSSRSARAPRRTR